jgi:hypothetical protein
MHFQVYREKTGESEPLKDELTLAELGFKVRNLLHQSAPYQIDIISFFQENTEFVTFLHIIDFSQKFDT